jgi:hypothetical protein
VLLSATRRAGRSRAFNHVTWRKTVSFHPPSKPAALLQAFRPREPVQPARVGASHASRAGGDLEGCAPGTRLSGGRPLAAKGARRLSGKHLRRLSSPFAVRASQLPAAHSRAQAAAPQAICMRSERRRCIGHASLKAAGLGSSGETRLGWLLKPSVKPYVA